MHEITVNLTGLIVLILVLYLVISDFLRQKERRKAAEIAATRKHELEMEKAKQVGQYLTNKEYEKLIKEIDKAKPPVANGVLPVADEVPTQPKREI